MPIGGQPGAPDESTPGTTTQPLTAPFDRSTRTGDVRKSASPSGRFRADSTARLSGHDEDVADLVVETEGPTKRYGDRLAVDTSSLWSAAASRMTGRQPSRPPQQRTPPVASDTGGRPGPAIARLRPRSMFAAVPGAVRPGRRPNGVWPATLRPARSRARKRPPPATGPEPVRVSENALNKAVCSHTVARHQGVDRDRH